MNLKELIESTNKVHNRDKASVFQKKFGSIYAFNKNITIAKGGNAIVINMMIGGVTDMIKTGGKRTPVPYHKVSLALNLGKEGRKDYTADELVAAIRLRNKEYADKEEWSKEDILKLALENPTKFFADATIFKTTNGSGYSVVSNQIPEDVPVQVWCSCSDYYWTFQYYNMTARNKDGTSVNANLYGSVGYAKTYNHRSEAGKKSKVPLRNPGRHPGMCKHLMLLVAMLMKEELLKNTRNGLVKFYNANYAGFIKGNEKERVNQGTFANMMKNYKKGQEELNKERNEAHYLSGNKVESKFNAFTQKRTIRGSESGFNPFTQERTNKKRKK